MCVCECACGCVRVYGQHLHKCGNSQNTNPKKTFVTFCETFYTMPYIHIYVCVLVCIFCREVPVGVTQGRGLRERGLTTHTHTTVEAGQKESSVRSEECVLTQACSWTWGARGTT